MAGITGLLEQLGSIYIAGESIKAGAAANTGNTASDYPHVQTGVDSDGSTLLKGNLIAGIPNAALLGGAGVLLLAAVAFWAVKS